MESIDLGSLAQQYFNKSIEMGGGNRSFVGWKISEFLDSTSNGTYSIVLITDKKLILKGLPLADKNYDWAVRTKITKDKINTDIMN